MPDPVARFGGGLGAKERQRSPSGGNGVTDLLAGLLRGNRQGNQLFGGNPGSVVGSAQKRSKGRASGGPSGMDDIMGLQNLLGAYAGQEPANMEQLQAELRKAIAGQFDPMITNATKDIAGAKKRAGGAKKDIGAIYNDLVGYYEGQVAPTKERAKEAKASAANNASGTKQSITDDYAARLRDQVDEYKRLGIESATPDATSQQDADLANQLAIAENTRSSEEAALNQQAQGDLGYWTEGAGIAKGEGAEQQSMITQQLNQYLNQQNGQLNLLKGQKDSAYHQGLMQLQQQASEASSQHQNQLWDRMLELAKLKLSMSNSASSGGKDPGRGLTGALSFLQQSGSGSLGSTFQDYLGQSQRWANTPSAKAMYGGAVDTPEEWAQVMRDNAANQGKSQNDQTALWQAMLRYMGRG